MMLRAMIIRYGRACNNYHDRGCFRGITRRNYVENKKEQPKSAWLFFFKPFPTQLAHINDSSKTENCMLAWTAIGDFRYGPLPYGIDYQSIVLGGWIASSSREVAVPGFDMSATSTPLEPHACISVCRHWIMSVEVG